MARQVFFSFHYKPDSWRAAQVRNMGVIEGSNPVSDNDWEKVTSGGDAAIKKWIAGQLQGKSCAVVLAGSLAASRKWIRYEAAQAWGKGMGVVVIYIHGLKDLDGKTSNKGVNPLSHVIHSPTKKKLSTICKAYDPAGSTSQQRYAWIKKHLANAVEEAIKIRKQYAA